MSSKRNGGEGSSLLARLTSVKELFWKLTVPFWMGWSLIFRGDKEFPERYEAWSKGKEISSSTGNPDDPTVFWLCGYSASVSPFQALIDKISASFGMNIYARSLAGHDGSFWHFANSRSWHWYLDAERRFLQLHKKTGKPLILAGISTGALVAMLLAYRHPGKVKGLVLDAAALRLSNRASTWLLWGVLVGYHLALLSPLLAWLLLGAIPLLVWVLFAGAIFSWGFVTESSLVPPEVDLDERERVELYYGWLPIVTTSTLPLMQLVTWFILPKIKCPALVCHGVNDPVIPLDAGREVWTRLGSRAKWFRAFNDASHPVLLSQGADDYFDLISAFAKEIITKDDPRDYRLPFEAEFAESFSKDDERGRGGDSRSAPPPDSPAPPAR